MPRLRPSVRISDPRRPVAVVPLVREPGTAEAVVGVRRRRATAPPPVSPGLSRWAVRLVRRSAGPGLLLDELAGDTSSGAPLHPRAPPPQLPALFQRPAHLARRHLDADGRRVVAGLPADRIAGAPRRRRIRQPDSGVPPRHHRRHGRRPLQPPPDPGHHADHRRWCCRSSSPRSCSPAASRCGTSSRSP